MITNIDTAPVAEKPSLVPLTKMHAGTKHGFAELTCAAKTAICFERWA